jgi:hypothetical protein
VRTPESDDWQVACMLPAETTRSHDRQQFKYTEEL